MGSIAATEFVAGVRTWLDRLGLSIKDAARHVGVDADELERVLKFPEETLPVRAVLEILGGLGLGLVGVDELSPVALLRRLDQLREAKGMSKKSLAASAEVNRTYMTTLFQEVKPEPRLGTILKLAGALEIDLVIEKQRELAPLEPLPEPVAPAPPDRAATITQAHLPEPAAPVPPGRAATITQAPLPESVAPDRAGRATTIAQAPPPSAPTTTATEAVLAQPVAGARPASPDGPAPRVRPELRDVLIRPERSTVEGAGSPATSPRRAPAADPVTTPVSSSTAPPTSATNATDGPSMNSARPPTPPSTSPPASSPRSPDRPVIAPIPSAKATPPPESVDAAARPAPPTSASPRPAESAKPTTTTANASPKISSGTATAAVAAAGVTVAAGRWLSDASFARLTEEVAAARVQTAAAEHQTALVRQQMEYEQQLAEQRAAEQTALARLTERQAALRSTVVLGGTATAAVVGGSTALAFVAPADRRTAQAVISLAGGAAALAGAMADRNSSTRGALLGAGGGLLLAAVIDLLRQSASKTLGGIAGVTCRVTNLHYPIIETVAPRSSAGQAGLMQGDVVIRVDGVAVEAVGITAALQRMRGEIGTSVELVVLRDHYEITVVVVRAAV